MEATLDSNEIKTFLKSPYETDCEVGQSGQESFWIFDHEAEQLHLKVGDRLRYLSLPEDRKSFVRLGDGLVFLLASPKVGCVESLTPRDPDQVVITLQVLGPALM